MKNVYTTIGTLLVFFSCQNILAQCDMPANVFCSTVITSDDTSDGDWYWYWIDEDGDGYGRDGGTINDGQCFQNQPLPPQGYATLCGDCNDDNPNIQTERNLYYDSDGDGDGTNDYIVSCIPTGFYTAFNNLDCDDTNPSLNHLTKWYLDNDDDTFGNPDVFVTQCENPSTSTQTYVLNANDCNDNNATTTTLLFYRDSDGDGDGDPNNSIPGCTPANGYVSNNNDCDDTNSLLNSNTAWYPDNDGDGYGNHNVTPVFQCIKPTGYAMGEPDCNDNNAGRNPSTIWYLDTDGDGYGDNEEEILIQCTRPSGYVLNIVPVEQIPETTLPSYSNLDINDLTFIQKIEPKQEVATLSQLNTLSEQEKIQSKTYFDGIGRPIQQIAIATGGYEQDIIQHIDYDQFGRQIKQYLPYAKNTSLNGGYRKNAKAEVYQFYQSKTLENGYIQTDNPFSESVFERAPTNRIVHSGNVGTSWEIGSGHEVESSYDFNKENDVRIFKVNLTNHLIPTIVDTQEYYPANELTVTIAKDENWVNGVNNTVEKYTDKEGRLILKRNYVDGVRLSTYNVYDVYGNLTYILPPKVEPDNNPITQDIISELCFQFCYDGLRRQIMKKTPDVTSWERIIYDEEDRPILVRDPNIRIDGSWLYTKYDKFGRAVYTGLYKPPFSKTQEELQEEVRLASNTALYRNEQRGTSTIDGHIIGYTNNAFPKEHIELLTVTYYDDYGYQDSDKPTTPSSVNGKTVTQNVKGLPVALWSRTIGENSWNKMYSFYDNRGRLLRSINKNHLGGFTETDYTLDFRGKTIDTKKTHQRNSTDATFIVEDRYVYDRTERIKATYKKINNGSEKRINGFVYDALGKLIVKYIEPVTEDFGYELVQTRSSRDSKNTFTNQEVQGNWKPRKSSNATVKITKNTLKGTLLTTRDYVKGYYKLEAGVEYEISFNLDKTNFSPDINFGIYGGKDVLETSILTNSGIQTIYVTPTVTGSHYLSFRIFKNNPSRSTQEFLLDNISVKKALALPTVLALKDINALQQIDYRYNERGMLTNINDYQKLGDDVFALRLNYDRIESPATKAIDIAHSPTFNGDVSQMIWITKNDEVVRDYKYRYDALSRLKGATFSDTNYDLRNVTYDKNGNITTLSRDIVNGNKKYNYNYNGNQLTRLNYRLDNNGTVTTNVRTYTYDSAGNLKSDLSKGILDIEYNFLGLPEKVIFANNTRIEYDYDASGIKIQKRYYAGSGVATTDYLGIFQYINTGLQFLAQAEGYIVPQNNNTSFQYVYNYTDHLGNVRISYADINNSGSIDVSNELVDEHNYYPFGLEHQGYNATVTDLGSVFNFGFGGKENQEENGISWVDFGSRNYDAELGRWFNRDPQNQFGSPYLYAFNNPINSIDPDGEFAILAGVIAGAVIGGGTVALSNPRANFGDILGGAMLGGITGAITGSVGGAGINGVLQVGTNATLQGGLTAVQGGNFLESAATGLVGGFLSQFGGGSFLSNVAWGAGEGAATGAFGAAISGNDLGKGILIGAATGAASATIFSTAESIQNAVEGYGFGTNDGRFNKLAKEVVATTGVGGTGQKALDYWTLRFGGPKLNFVYGKTITNSRTGKINIGYNKFTGGSGHVRRAISHELGHYYNDIVWKDDVVGGIPLGRWHDNSVLYGGDGTQGYHYAIKNAGKNQVGRSAIIDSKQKTSAYSRDAWKDYGIVKWWHLIPRRF